MLDTLPARPARFGPYEIVRVLGRGGMGEVLEGRHCGLGARVAIKVMRPGAAADGETVRRLLREGRATAAIRHPNVVTVIDVGVDGERPYLVMEFLDGEDLAHRLGREAPLSVDQTVRLILPIASAIAAAHDAGIVHRDLKPSNVVLARRWAGIEPVVVDFGISKALGVTHDATSSSRVVAGTPQYMAPEQLRTASEVTPAVDQYALGALMYHCLTGGTPFWNEDYYELLHSIMTADLVDPRELNPLVPPDLGAIVLKALARDPDARFQSVKALGGALLPFADDDEQRRWRSQFALTVDSPPHQSGTIVIDRAAAASRATTPPRIAPIASRIIHDSEGLLVAEIGVICAVVWRQSVTKQMFELQRSGLAAVVDRHPHGAGFLCVVEETCSPMPNDELRRASGEMVASHGARLACLALVVEATGFSAAVIRGVITGMLFFVRLGSDIPVAVFSNIRDALPWMSEFVRVGSADAFMSSLAEFRRAPPATVADTLDGQDDTTVATLVGDAGAGH